MNMQVRLNHQNVRSVVYYGGKNENNSVSENLYNYYIQKLSK